MRENEVILGCLQQGAGLSIEERERERWSLLRAARDEADRSLSLAAILADKEAALSYAHATINEVIFANKIYFHLYICKFFLAPTSIR